MSEGVRRYEFGETEWTRLPAAVHPDPRSPEMTDSESVDQQGDDKGLTSPDADHPGEATSPPGNPEIDEEANQESEEKLDQAGGGH
jgi:hypothetical protein